MKHKQEQEAAVTAATEKLKSELQTPGANLTEVTARHAEELRALEARLMSKHEEELKAAIEKARSEGGGATTTDDTISKAEHEQALKAATERGRMEISSKLKLRESMLAKVQANVKNLEAQIKAWRDAGIIPADAPTLAQNAATASTSTPAKPAPVKQPVTPATSNTATNGTPVVPAAIPMASLPRKPSLNAGIAPAAITGSTEGTTAIASRGARGAARGATRGVARGAGRGTPVARGGAPAAIAATQAAAAANAASDGSGMSIMGAAAKRPREEADANAAADSLAKRIKAAETGAKPITLRRDRIVTTTNTNNANTPNPPS